MLKTKAKSFWFQTPWRHHKQHRFFPVPGELISCYRLIFTRCIIRSNQQNPVRLAINQLLLRYILLAQSGSLYVSFSPNRIALSATIYFIIFSLCHVSVTLPLALAKPHINSCKFQTIYLNNISNCHYRPSIQTR